MFSYFNFNIKHNLQLLMILSCREQKNLVGDVSGYTSLTIGHDTSLINPMMTKVSPETSPNKLSFSRHDKIINNMNAEQTNQNNIFTIICNI